jgi:hypothetical protein
VVDECHTAKETTGGMIRLTVGGNEKKESWKCQRMINDVESCLGSLGAVFTAICNIHHDVWAGQSVVEWRSWPHVGV